MNIKIFKTNCIIIYCRSGSKCLKQKHPFIKEGFLLRNKHTTFISFRYYKCNLKVHCMSCAVNPLDSAHWYTNNFYKIQ